MSASLAVVLAFALACCGEKLNVLDYGAVGNGVALDSAAVQRAIEAALLLPGANCVLFPTGYVFLMGSIFVQSASNLALVVEAGAELRGSTNSSDYALVDALPSYPVTTSQNSQPRYAALISFIDSTNVSLAGGGVIDGNGAAWWEAFKRGKLGHQRPPLVEALYCNGVTVRQVTMRFSAMYAVHPYACSNVLIEDVTVFNPPGSPNTDGIDPDSCDGVIIQRVTVTSGDDMISCKSGASWPGVSFGRPTRNVLVQDSLFLSGAGLAIGSETSGGIFDVVFRNNTLLTTANGVRLKTCPSYGGGITNVTYDGLALEAGGVAVYVNMKYECDTVNSSIADPVIAQLMLANISGHVAGAGSLYCLPNDACHDWSFQNVHLASDVTATWLCTGSAPSAVSASDVNPSWPGNCKT